MISNRAICGCNSGTRVGARHHVHEQPQSEECKSHKPLAWSHGVGLPDMLKQTNRLETNRTFHCYNRSAHVRASRRQHVFLDVRKFRNETVEASLTVWMNAKFVFQNELADDALLYSCNQLNLHCKVQIIAPPPILTVRTHVEVNVVAVECAMMSGNVIFQQEFEKTHIPTYAFIKNKTWSVMVEANLISRQQYIKLILSNGENPCARAKVWKQYKRKK